MQNIFYGFFFPSQGRSEVGSHQAILRPPPASPLEEEENMIRHRIFLTGLPGVDQFLGNISMNIAILTLGRPLLKGLLLSQTDLSS
jgi:hypothetical protein